MAVQMARVTGVAPESASRNGYRFVGRWAQDANPVTNRGCGNTSTRGSPTTATIWCPSGIPVSTPSLPDSVEALSADQMALFNSDPQAYIDTQIEMLNRLTAADF